jgi:hypothetical protein
MQISLWIYISGILLLLLFASVIYTRIIKNNEIFEHFSENYVRPTSKNNILFNQQINMGPTKCTKYIVDSKPISSMFNIDDMCHTDNKKEQLHWNCFYRYQLEKNLLSDPKAVNEMFRKDFPIFYKV